MLQITQMEETRQGFEFTAIQIPKPVLIPFGLVGSGNNHLSSNRKESNEISTFSEAIEWRKRSFSGGWRIEKKKGGRRPGGETQKNRFRHEITICLVFLMYRKTYTFNSLLRYNWKSRLCITIWFDKFDIEKTIMITNVMNILPLPKFPWNYGTHLSETMYGLLFWLKCCFD